MEKYKSIYIIDSINNEYKVTIGAGGLREAVEKALIKGQDIAQLILDSNQISFGDNLERLQQFKDYVTFLMAQEI